MAGNNQLARRNDASADTSFVQQGQVDWVAFGNTLVTASIATLQRLSNSGVQELTYAAGLQLATRFRIGDIGQRRVEEAVQNLGSHAGFDNVLYFGFGYRSFARVLAESVPGLKCLALCACVAEMHTEIAAATILSALWTAVEYPDEYKPSISQFLCLIKACSGVISKSTFSETASVMLRSIPLRDSTELKLSPAEDIARVLTGLFDVSEGVRDQIVVTGGAECMFVAAISEWLFNFKTHVENDEGDTLFTSCGDCSTAQVQIHLGPLPGSSGISVARSTYVLRQPQDMILITDDDKSLLLNVRVSWDKCFQTIFATGFQILADMPNMLGTYLGSWSRLYLEKSLRYRDTEPRSPEACYGRGLVLSVMKNFPELDRPDIWSTAYPAAGGSIETAIAAIGNLTQTFRQRCSCRSCLENIPHGERGFSLDGDCILVLPHIMLDLARLLVWMQPDPSLYPTFRGIVDCYLEAGYSLNTDPVEVLNQGPLEDYRMVSSSVMKRAIQLFTGYRAPSGADEHTAIVQGGICFYVEALRNITADCDQLSRVYIVPGYISLRHQKYDVVKDGISIRDAPLTSNIEYQVVEGSAARVCSRKRRGESVEATALVRETGNDLAFCYKLTTPRDQICVQPRGFTHLYNE